MIYCQAILQDGGLGNRLFPWARCRVFSHLHKIPMLTTSWVQMKLGPILRRERDPRFYHNLFLPAAGEIRRVKKWWVSSTVGSAREPQCLEDPLDPNLKNARIIFNGVGEWFRPISPYRPFLYKELLSITRPCWLKAVDQLPSIPIGIHVRRGDLSVTPLDWFVQTLKSVRNALGFCAEAVVMSDAPSANLKELLRENRVRYASTESAIADILMLAKTKVLIASGSSFSAWASFLGQMPTLFPPGQSPAYFRLEHPEGSFAEEFNPDGNSRELLDQVRHIWEKNAS